jgi:hypothetical protein
MNKINSCIILESVGQMLHKDLYFNDFLVIISDNIGMEIEF